MKSNEIKKGLKKYLDFTSKCYEHYKRAWSNETDKPTEDGIESMINALAYIEQLEAKVERLQNKCEDCAGCTQWKCDCANIESEAIKEFVEQAEKKRTVAIHCDVYEEVVRLEDLREMVIINDTV